MFFDKPKPDNRKGNSYNPIGVNPEFRIDNNKMLEGRINHLEARIETVDKKPNSMPVIDLKPLEDRVKALEERPIGEGMTDIGLADIDRKIDEIEAKLKEISDKLLEFEQELKNKPNFSYEEKDNLMNFQNFRQEAITEYRIFANNVKKEVGEQKERITGFRDLIEQLSDKITRVKVGVVASEEKELKKQLASGIKGKEYKETLQKLQDIKEEQ